MAHFTVKHATRYRAKIRLGFFERVVSNDSIEDKLRHAGFVSITVWGNGRNRWAEVTWPGEDRTTDMPSQIVSMDAAD